MPERRFTPDRFAGLGLETRVGSDTPLVVGFAAVYYDGTKDSEYQLWDDLVERLAPGCFDRAVKEGMDVCALFNHNPDYILARTPGTLTLELAPKGLRYRFEPPNTQCGRDLVESLKRGDIRGSSFAFEPTRVEYIKGSEGKPAVRLIREVKLYDVSPVTYPAYGGTSAGVEGGDRSIDPNVQCRAIGDLSREKQWLAEQIAQSANRAKVLTKARTVEMEMG